MNVLDLQNLGVEEINEMEVRDVEGGWINTLQSSIRFQLDFIEGFFAGWADGHR
ncbi:hypothetical protein [Dysgonomonas capnocytophagoides]|uniref:hypothetical protein n=1 Tax=Dysgonomonas capnocytophagoides TaxID=45254 RepID=UPI00141B7834|nr:hypothetical protein [Dysgonomonas capnocytophagoides]